MADRLNELRHQLAEIHIKLIEAEAELADRLAEIHAFEFAVEARLGHLYNELESVAKEIQRYNDHIQMARNKQIFGNAYLSVADQYRRTWGVPHTDAPMPPTEPLPPTDEAEIKKIYRQLARRFHPDLATDDRERVYRTQKMAAINDAYAARSLVELIALSQEEVPFIQTRRAAQKQTEAQLIAALEKEHQRCQRRLQTIDREMRGISQRASVELSLAVKSAQQKGRDLIEEMATELNQKLARKRVERDMLKSQFDQLGPDQGFIHIER